MRNWIQSSCACLTAVVLREDAWKHIPTVDVLCIPKHLWEPSWMRAVEQAATDIKYISENVLGKSVKIRVEALRSNSCARTPPAGEIGKLGD